MKHALVSSIAALTLLAATAARAEEPKPVFVTMAAASLGKAKAQVPLLEWGIGAWAGHFVNQDSMVKVARYRATLGDFDLENEVARTFGCLGAADDCTARIALTDAAEFEAALRARPDRGGIVVEVLSEMLPEQMLLRASVHHVTLNDPAPGSKKKEAKLTPGIGYIAVATVRAPARLAALRKTDPAALDHFWTQGEPSHLVGETQRGLARLDELLDMLARDGRADGKMPDAWKSLPKVKQFKDSGRIACSGPAWCASTYVLKDNGDSFVLVSSGSTAGWFDALAAAKETNLLFMAMMGIPGN